LGLYVANCLSNVLASVVTACAGVTVFVEQYREVVTWAKCGADKKRNAETSVFLNDIISAIQLDGLIDNALWCVNTVKQLKSGRALVLAGTAYVQASGDLCHNGNLLWGEG
jgi:hypothetical protein